MRSRRSLLLIALAQLATSACARQDESTAGEASQAIGLSPTREIEPNGALASATPIGSDAAALRGILAPAGDVDVYSFQGAAGDRVYAATMPAAASGPYTDTLLTLLDPGGAVVESDDNDGELPNNASSLAGVVLQATGTHYLRVQHVTDTAEIRPYDLYFQRHTGPLTPDVEPNDTQAAAQPITPGVEIEGYAKAPSPDIDYFALPLAQGDTVYYAIDEDPAGFAGFQPYLTVEMPSGYTFSVQDFAISATERTSSAGVFTANESGAHFFKINPSSNQLVHYRLSVSVFPSAADPDPCLTFDTADPLPMAIGPATAASLILVDPAQPGNPDFAGDVDVFVHISHPKLSDVDLTIQPPFGAEVPLMTDILAPVVDGVFDESGALPADASFAWLRGQRFRAEVPARVAWLHGVRAKGPWTLRAYDQVPASNSGQLLGWSLRICPTPELPACPAGTAPATAMYASFDADADGFTLRGKNVEWERGVPSGTAIAGCAAAGGSCFKTDLDSSYSPHSFQDLVSRHVDLSGFTGPIQVSWMQAHELEDARWDHAWVDLEAPATGLHRTLWRHEDGTMLAQVSNPPTFKREPAGWAKHVVRIDEAAGQLARLVFHLDSDGAGELSGLAIDEVKIVGCRSTVCGNGTLDPGEQCDDGNPDSNDGCDANCTPTSCGNGILTAGEQCDDGNTAAGDECGPTCQTTLCGDGDVDPGEQCDDGNFVEGDACDTTCAPPSCGNGVLDPAEDCDDGNTAPGDGCAPDCRGFVVPTEVEPNDLAADATPLQGPAAVIEGDLFPANDVDMYSFAASAGDRASYRLSGLMNSTTIELRAPDGSLVPGSQGNIGQAAVANLILPQTGTYRVVLTKGQSQGARYELHVHVRTGAALSETEPNDAAQTANPIPTNTEVSAILPIFDDQDFYAVELSAGETLVVLGNAPGDMLLRGPTGSSYQPGVGLLYTAEVSGRYLLSFGEGAGVGAAVPYRFSIAVVPKRARPGACHTYSSTQPALIPDPGVVTSTVAVPDAFEIGDVDVSIKLQHPFTDQVSATLVAPSGNEVIAAHEVPLNAVGLPGLAASFDDEATYANNFTSASFAYVNRYEDMRINPGLSRLAWFDGQASQGTWSLKVRDSETGSVGLLTGWSLVLCERPVDATPCPSGTVKHEIEKTDFELSSGAWIHDGAGDAWQWGTPTSAPITTCASGAKCFKTNLSGNYAAPSTQHLRSPYIPLAQWQPPIFVEWKQKYELGNATSHRAWVDVDIDSLPDPVTPLWRHDSTSMSNYVGSLGPYIRESAGWATQRARMDGLAGTLFRVQFHLDVSQGGYSGLAIDDFRVIGCKPIQCGDGFVEQGESCDDANVIDGDGCDANCTPTACGNGIVTMGEACDDGNAVNGDGCDANCKVTGCGNGVVSMGEACDDGNLASGDGCDANCTFSACGNGIAAGGEGCDDGNLTSGDGCDSNCTVTACGNGVVTGAEVCDDGNLEDGDGCDSNCTVTGCGNGAVGPGEACDDGNLVDGDGCDSNCTVSACGNGVVTPGEVCDDGNPLNADGCDTNCTPSACGNGIAAGGEGCDDGNLVDGDGCDSDCTPTGCGNGVLTAPEICDDGNLINGDGCDASCTPTGCGNGVVTAGEACDDANAADGDGCDSNCTPTSCGNGVVTAGEACDDANAVDGDGCDSNCTPTGCGNGVLTAGEECDDGNLASNDGCSSTCILEGSTGTGGAGGSTTTSTGGSATTSTGGLGGMTISPNGGGGHAGAGGSTGGGGDAGASGSVDGPEAPGGCGCSVNDRSGRGAAWLLVGIGLLLGRRRRSRARS